MTSLIDGSAAASASLISAMSLSNVFAVAVVATMTLDYLVALAFGKMRRAGEDRHALRERPAASSTTQCAAVSTHCGAIRLPPQNCASGCEFGLSSSISLAEQRHLERPFALAASVPPKTRSPAPSSPWPARRARRVRGASARLRAASASWAGASVREWPPRAPAATLRRTV